MSVSLGLVANVYNEIRALPGWLATHVPFFDDVRILHAGPQGERSTDGTIEFLEEAHIPVEYCAIDEGFGVVRTKAIRMSPCEYVMVLDADERFYPSCRLMTCKGKSTPHTEVDRILGQYDFRDGKTPDWNEISKLGSELTVEYGEIYNQGAYLREILETHTPDVIHTIRRHWHDLSMTRPTQNWVSEPDWQARIVRNDSKIHYDYGTRMHERLVGTGKLFGADMGRGPFFDHFHFYMKKLEQDQRSHDVMIYDSIHKGKTPPTWKEFSGE